jgi:hypothetical protein
MIAYVRENNVNMKKDCLLCKDNYSLEECNGFLEWTFIEYVFVLDGYWLCYDAKESK